MLGGRKAYALTWCYGFFDNLPGGLGEYRRKRRIPSWAGGDVKHAVTMRIPPFDEASGGAGDHVEPGERAQRSANAGRFVSITCRPHQRRFRKNTHILPYAAPSCWTCG